MTTFYLLRHGNRVSRGEDTLLSAFGEQQATLTAQYFQDHHIQTIHASPLPRTCQTAGILSATLRVPVVVDDRLRERMIFDESRGESFAQFLTYWDKTMGDRYYQPPYGDSAVTAGQRLQTPLDEIVDDQEHIIISHGGIIGDVLRNLFTDQPLSFRVDPASKLRWVDINECAITEIQKTSHGYVLIRVNDGSHLK
jgi:broad specificity phosphatase PhoE